MRAMIFASLALLALLVGFTVDYFVLRYMRLIGNIFLSLVYKPSQEPPASARGDRLTIVDSSDHEIDILLIEKRYSKKAVIFCHESGMNKESWESYAYFLPELGYSMISMDFDRPSEQENNSLSQWPTQDDVQKVLTVIRWAKRVLHLDLQIVLFGISNGADIAFAASFEDASVRGVVADGLFSMEEIFRDYIRKWAPMLVRPNPFGERLPGWVVNLFAALGFWYSQKQSKKRFVNVEDLLRRRHVPLLMIHGERDDYVPENHQKFLRSIPGEPGKFQHLTVSQAGHNQAVQVAREVYEETITGFLTKIS